MLSSLSLLSFINNAFSFFNLKSHHHSHMNFFLCHHLGVIILQFMFRSVTDLGLTVVKSVKSASDGDGDGDGNGDGDGDLHADAHCPSSICWGNCLFSVVLPLHLCQRLVGYICVGLFLGSRFCSMQPFFCFFTSARPSWLGKLYVKPWRKVVSVSQLCSLSFLCWPRWVFCLSTLQNCFVDIHKMTC